MRITTSNKINTRLSYFFIFYLIGTIHLPYYHLHTKSETHISEHENHSELSSHNSDNQPQKSNTNLSKNNILKNTHQSVIRHLHFTRELYGTRKIILSKARTYKRFASNAMLPDTNPQQISQNTLNDLYSFHIMYNPAFSKIFSGLSPPVS
jgi:hypothetical protein